MSKLKQWFKQNKPEYKSIIVTSQNNNEYVYKVPAQDIEFIDKDKFAQARHPEYKNVEIEKC